ncbi:MAG: thioredoxin family protein [Gemmatimonadota bacterium]|jgi:small redox-active disulfide protein 2
MSIEKIQVLGTGCPKCQKLEENARAAIRELGLDITVEKVTDIAQIARMGAMMTPALAVDGAVRSAGHLLSVNQVKTLLQG